MRTRFLPSVIVQALAWGILGSAFVIVSAPHVWDALRVAPTGVGSPWQTTDNYGARLLKISQGSERLAQTFTTLPPDRPVAVILPEGNDEALFVGYLLSYFGWPRDVRIVAVNRENAARELERLDRRKLAAIFFCGTEPPPALQPSRRIGAGLTMVLGETGSEAKEP